MAFQNIVFPNLKLIHGLKKSALLPVSIVTNGSSEFRIARMRFDKFTWTYPGRVIMAADKLALYNFYKTVHGATDSFKFADPDYPAWTGETLTWSSGTYWKFNFPNSVDHPLFNYDSAMVVKKNGSTVTWAHAIVNGLPYLSIPSAISSDVITVTSGAIYLAARFDQAMSWSLEALDTNNKPYIVNLDNLTLQEVFEHA